MFEPVVTAVDATVPGVEVLRPGLLVLAARGAARYFGSEEAAAERLVDAVAAAGAECWIGIADELSTAVLAARKSAIVLPGRGAQFLAPLPVRELAAESALAAPERTDLVDLLHRLGLRRIGDFAALTPTEVASRFGTDAIAAHRCARAEPERPPAAHPPSPELTVENHCDPPIDRVDAAAFMGRMLATELHAKLSAAGVACTRLSVQAETEAGEHLSRIWRCAEPLTPDATADRIRWQLDGWLTRRVLGGNDTDQSTVESDWPDSSAREGGWRDTPARDGNGAGRPIPEGRSAAPTQRSRSDAPEPRKGLPTTDSATRGEKSRRARRAMARRAQREENWGAPTAPITLLRLEPVEVVSAGALQLGLWGGVGEEEERARRALVRVQGLLGGESVRVGVLSGGRGPAERITMVTLGEELVPAADPAKPWPGRLPEPAPTVILTHRPEVRLESADGTPVWVTDRGLFTADPVHLHWGSRSWQLTGWAGPWPLDDRWWTPQLPHGYAARAQVQLDGDLRALLLLAYDQAWHVEGLYE